MAWRTTDQPGRQPVHVETRGAELPVGMPAPARPADPGGPSPERGEDGRLRAGQGTKELARKGGQAKARRQAEAKAWGSTLGLGRLLDDGELNPEARLAPFVAEAEAWHKAQCEAVARDVGGGQLSPGVVSILRTAAWERAFSAFLFDCATRTAFAWDVDQGRQSGKVLPRFELAQHAARLGDSARQNLLAAHELAAREAQARPRENAVQAMRARILQLGKGGRPT